MARKREPVPKRVRLVAVVAASLLLTVAVLNLVLVAEQAPEINPSVREGRTWQTGTGTPDRSGQHRWEFVVDAGERRVVELEVRLDHRVQVTHVDGEATLHHRAAMWVDGERLDAHSEVVSAEPRSNSTERRSRTWIEEESFVSALRIERDRDSGPFVLLVTWDWELQAGSGAQATFGTTIRPVAVEAVDLGGIPGCAGSTCARILTVAAAGAQLAALAWYRTARGRGGSSADGEEDAPRGPAPSKRREDPRQTPREREDRARGRPWR